MDFNAYEEPNYNDITKHEKFDEDTVRKLCNDPRFCKADKDRLQYYFKHRLSGSNINVSYKLSAGCEEEKLGRLFPVDGCGLQSFRFDIRNPIADKYYWDIDVENCHYVIAYHWANRYGIKNDAIKHYIINREECLKMVSPDRKKAKTEFLKVLYGGDIKLYSEHYNEVEGNLIDDGLTFLQKIKKEVDTLMVVVWNDYTKYHKLKIGKEKKPIDKKPNPKASLLSLLFQTEERKILMVIDWVLRHQDRYMGVFIHDGGLVEKLEGETKFPEEWFPIMSSAIKTIYDYDVKITQKPIKYDWTPYKPQETQYEVMKREFEQNNFMIGCLLNCIHSDGYVEQLKISDARIKFSNKLVEIYDEEKGKTIRKKFLDMWLEDPKRLSYERMDFFPNRSACPSTVYNLFKGFNAEQYECNKTPEEQVELVQPIINHIRLLTSGNEQYLLKWFANIIQYPDIKSEVAQVLRDINGLLVEGGGVGKNLLIEWFGREILGDDYFVVVNDNKELYSQFNSLFEAKLLVFIEEASGKENHANTDTLKAKVTNKKTNVNKKMVAQYKINDYARYIFSSNNSNCLPIRQGDRRFIVYDADRSKRGNVEYFKTLATHMEKPEAKRAFYNYLKDGVATYSSPIDFWNSRPITEAYRDIRRINAPLYHKWIVSLLRTGELVDGNVNDLYKNFLGWVETNRERSKDGVLTQTAFGKLLNDASSESGYELMEQGNKSMRRGCKYMNWDIPAVVKGLKGLYLIEPEFEYKTKEELDACQIVM